MSVFLEKYEVIKKNRDREKKAQIIQIKLTTGGNMTLQHNYKTKTFQKHSFPTTRYSSDELSKLIRENARFW